MSPGEASRDARRIALIALLSFAIYRSIISYLLTLRKGGVSFKSIPALSIADVAFRSFPYSSPTELRAETSGHLA